ncbi:hypothetical protein D3C76_1328980 [compost metagenome]
MAQFKIEGWLRVAAVLAQVGHESGQLRTLVENLNYSAKGLIRTWAKRFNLITVNSVARKPEQIANIASPRCRGHPSTLRVEVQICIILCFNRAKIDAARKRLTLAMVDFYVFALLHNSYDFHGLFF